tara:strand:- start:114 stop:380 length:267 start_codon:yes stop_codon:yes gene_type:complete
MNENKRSIYDIDPLIGESAGIYDIKITTFKQKDITRFESITNKGKNVLSYLINNLDINAIEISTADGYSLEHEIKKAYDVLIQKMEVD